MKILLLSEAPMNIDSGGIGQTLYNLLSFTEGKDLLCISPKKELERFPPSEPFKACYKDYVFEWIEMPPNRLTAKFYKLVRWINYSINVFRSFKTLKTTIQQFSPDVVISCPNGAIGVFMHKKLLSSMDVPVIPYFMDDWMYTERQRWLGGNLHQQIKELLASNHRWMVIGNELADVFIERYKVQPEIILPVHNPVSLNNAPAERIPEQAGKITLAYAGALWPMHFDALLIVAKAVRKLQLNQNIELVVYTRQNFWDWRKGQLEPLGVSYGGSIPYEEIHSQLAKADGLVLVSSFSEKLYTHAKASVQTKITDYLKSRQLVISCGPDYSANHTFLRKYDCGACIESMDDSVVADGIREVTENLSSYRYMVDNGWKILQEEFSFETIHSELKEFLSDSKGKNE